MLVPMTFRLRRLVFRRAILTVCVALASTCYGQAFNTTVTKPPVASNPQSSKSYAAAAQAQNAGDFPAAAKLWQSFLTEHGSDKLAAAAHHYLGVCQIQLNEFPAAISSFTQVVRLADASPDFLEETYVNLAWCHYVLGSQGDREQLEKAAITFAEHNRKFPQGKLLDQAVFYRGESLLQLGKIDSAIRAYRHIVANFPKSELRPNVLFALGCALQDSEKIDEAIEVYDQFLEEFETHGMVPDVIMRQAQAAMQQQDFKKGAALYEQAAEFEGYYAIDQATFQQAYCLAAQEQFLEAAELYEQLIEGHEESPLVPQSKLEAGRCYYRAEKFEQSIRWLEEVLKQSNESSLEAAHWITRILLDRDRPSVALKAAETAIQWAEENGVNSFFLPALHLDRGEALDALGDHTDQAISQYIAVVKTYPDSSSAPVALYMATMAAKKTENDDLLKQCIQKFRSQYPNHELLEKIKAIQAESALKAGDAESAERALRELSEEPEIEIAKPGLLKLRLGQSQFLQRKYAETVATVQPIAAQLPTPHDQAAAWYLVGASQCELAEFRSAVESFSAALLAQPEGRTAPETCHHLARALVKIGRHDDAILTLRRMLASFPHHELAATATGELARLALASNQIELAKSHYEALLTKFPDNATTVEAHAGLAAIALQSEAYESALEHAASALETAGDNGDGISCMRIQIAALQKLQRFEPCLDRIADIIDIMRADPNNNDPSDIADALCIRATCLTQLERWEQAQSALESVLLQSPDYARKDEILYQLGWVAKRLQRDPEAIRRFAQVADEFPHSRHAADANFLLGKANYEAERWEQAIPFLQRAFESSSAGTEVRERATHQLGWCLFRMKEFEKAQTAFAHQVEEMPHGELGADGRFMLAEACFRSKCYEQAQMQYELLSEETRLSPEAKSLVYLHAGQIANVNEQYEQAEFWLKRLPREFPDSPYRIKAIYELGVACEGQKAWSQAAAHFAAVAEHQSEIGAQGRYGLANLCARRNQYERAVREYLTLMYGYASMADSAAVRELKAKSGLAAGKIMNRLATIEADQAEEWLARAEKCFQYVRDQHADSELSAKANESLVRLASLRQ